MGNCQGVTITFVIIIYAYIIYLLPLFLILFFIFVLKTRRLTILARQWRTLEWLRTHLLAHIIAHSYLLFYVLGVLSRRSSYLFRNRGAWWFESQARSTPRGPCRATYHFGCTRNNKLRCMEILVDSVFDLMTMMGSNS